MEVRAILEKHLDSKVFLNYYYLKEELVAFCRQEGLQTTGSKEVLTRRIALYLEKGEKRSIQLEAHKRTSKHLQGPITKESYIEPHFVCTQQHRTFFEEAIGKSFSFNVAFQKWLKSNSGKTYQQAIEAYHNILEEKKKTKTVIDKQFEYNIYIRAFFEDNPGKTLKEAIKCWKYKKALPGINSYEIADLEALRKQVSFL